MDLGLDCSALLAELGVSSIRVSVWERFLEPSPVWERLLVPSPVWERLLVPSPVWERLLCPSKEVTLEPEAVRDLISLVMLAEGTARRAFVNTSPGKEALAFLLAQPRLQEPSWVNRFFSHAQEPPLLRARN